MTEHKRKYSNPFDATLSGIKDLFVKRPQVVPLGSEERLDGLVVGITGASSGLGFATAVEMAKLGARVVMICRSGIPEKGAEVAKLSGSDQVSMLHVDLSDFDSIADLCTEIVAQNLQFDIFVSNAAMVPASARETKQGLEEMFVVNFLSKFYLINRLVAMGRIASTESGWPRIVIVSSESHRNPESFEWPEFGVFKNYGMKDVVNRYSHFKLLLTTYAYELSRRLTSAESQIVVRSLCPGPVNSRIARETPLIFKPLLKLVFALFFKSPADACEPVVYFAARQESQPTPFDYLFLMSRVPVDDKVMYEENGTKLWELSTRLLDSIGYGEESYASKQPDQS